MESIMKNLLLPAALFLIFGFASAQDLPEFDVLDTDADGMLTAEDLADYENIDFATVDADGDGQVSAAEYEVLTEQ